MLKFCCTFVRNKQMTEIIVTGIIVIYIVYRIIKSLIKTNPKIKI